MKAILLLVALALAFTANAQTTRPLKKILELKIPGEQGANGASVTWHPVLKKYYASMAGNSEFFIGVYDATSKRLNDTSQQAFFDVRGLWYNPLTKTIQMNGYNEMGWAEYKLNAKGFPTGVKILHEGMNQPDEQSVGAFDTKSNVVYFLNDEGNLEKYNFKDGQYVEDINLSLGKTKNDESDDPDNLEALLDYNATTVIYTGIRDAEIGLLNVTDRVIELYDISNGYLTYKLMLPDNAPVEEALNFSYCNGIYWLFDKTTRVWKGYK